MITDFLLMLVMGLVGAVVGFVTMSWSYQRRLLALEEDAKIRLLAWEERFQAIERIITRQEKSAASQARWNLKKNTVEADAEKVLKVVGGGNGTPALHPWDPRTWGGSGG